MTSDLSLCGEEIRKTDHDAFLCGLFAPDESRHVFYALHLFYLETLRIRDLVNEAHLGHFRVQWWRDLIDAIHDGKQNQSENGTHKEIVEALEDKSVDKALFDSYFNARSFDMEDRAHDDMDALLKYCAATGGNGAAIKAQAMGAQHLDASKKVGTALALCDIIRTLPYQSRQGRCKIPLSLQRKHGLELKTFHDFKCDTALKACVADVVTEIQKLLNDARKEQATPQTQAVLLSTVGIEDYIKRLSKVGNDPFNPNIGGGRLSRQIKMLYRAWRKTF